MKTSNSLHTALHPQNLAGLFLYRRHGDFWFRHHSASDISLNRNKLYRTHGLARNC
jgi:hypothetical protein